MRCSVVALAMVLGGCSLDFVDPDDGGEPGDDTDPPPPPRCALGARYHMAQTDCGPLPPDAPPASCWWTINVAPSTGSLSYCWSDVCEGLTYECAGADVTSRNGNRLFHGTVLGSGELYWDGGGYQGGVYSPF